MKPPNKNGDPVAEAAVPCVKPSETENARCQLASVKASDLEQLARAYVAAADAEHEAKLARIEARDRLIEHAAPGFEFEGVRVTQRNCWRLTPEASAIIATTRAGLIEAGQAERVTSVVATRIGREEE
jgi:hypothetical protein